MPPNCPTLIDTLIGPKSSTHSECIENLHFLLLRFIREFTLGTSTIHRPQFFFGHSVPVRPCGGGPCRIGSNKNLKTGNKNLFSNQARCAVPLGISKGILRARDSIHNARFCTCQHTKDDEGASCICTRPSKCQHVASNPLCVFVFITRRSRRHHQAVRRQSGRRYFPPSHLLTLGGAPSLDLVLSFISSFRIDTRVVDLAFSIIHLKSLFVACSRGKKQARQAPISLEPFSFCNTSQ